MRVLPMAQQSACAKAGKASCAKCARAMCRYGPHICVLRNELTRPAAASSLDARRCFACDLACFRVDQPSSSTFAYDASAAQTIRPAISSCKRLRDAHCPAMNRAKAVTWHRPHEQWMSVSVYAFTVRCASAALGKRKIRATDPCAQLLTHSPATLRSGLMTESFSVSVDFAHCFICFRAAQAVLRSFSNAHLRRPIVRRRRRRLATPGHL